MLKNPTVVFPAADTVIIEEREMPAPLPGQALVKTRCSLISTGTELTILRGVYPPDSLWVNYGKYPFVPGYNNIGEVVEVGEGVDSAWIGKKVATLGTHSQYFTTPVGALQTIQRDIPDEDAVFFTIAVIVANSIRRGRVRWGEAVVVYGLGLLGQFAARFCQLSGARPVFGVDISDFRLNCLPDATGIVPVNSTKQDVVVLVKEMTRGRMADVVFEVTGLGELIPSELAPLRRQGRFVLLSSPHTKTLFDFSEQCNAPSFDIIGAHNASHPACATLDNPWTQERDAELFFDMVADGDLDMKPLISHREHFSQAPRLYQMLIEDRGSAMGVILEWDK